MHRSPAFSASSVLAGGLRWHAVTAGPPDGEPLVVLHGLGAAGEVQLPVARLLASRFRVLVPDLPGFGRSGDPTGALTMPELAEALAGFLAAVELPPAVMVGNSMGCQVLAHLGANHPERVRALVLQGPTVDRANRTVLRQAAGLLYDARIERPSLIALQIRGVRRVGLGRLMATTRHVVEDRIEDAMPQVRAPVLVVRGGRDTLVPQRWAEHLTRRAPRGTLRVVPGASHCMVYSAPLELSRLVWAFASSW